MTIDRALEVVGEDGLESGKGTWQEYLAAIQLGREALERVRQYRKDWKHWFSERLPGETEE